MTTHIKVVAPDPIDHSLKSDPAHLAALKEDMEELLPGNARPIGTVRVDAVHSHQLRLASVCWEGEGLKFPVTVDEPPSRGGDAGAPAPLSYFILGAATCLLTQFSKLAMLGELKVDSLSMTARGHFERKIEGAFTDVTYDVKIAGSEAPATIEKLSRDAERQCFASNTLKKALKLTTNVDYNGSHLLTLT